MDSRVAVLPPKIYIEEETVCELRQAGFRLEQTNGRKSLQRILSLPSGWTLSELKEWSGEIKCRRFVDATGKVRATIVIMSHKEPVGVLWTKKGV